MKKALISLGLTLLLLTIPVYADEEAADETAPSSSDAFEAATGRVGASVDTGAQKATGANQDAASPTIDENAETIKPADVSNALLESCDLYNSFVTEKNKDDNSECEENIQRQLDRILFNEQPSHAFFNRNSNTNTYSSSNENNRTVTGCCYANRYQVEFDENNDCQLNTAAEECELAIRELEIKKSCVCNKNPDNPICNQVFRCQINRTEPVAYDTDIINPFESEYFNVIDNNKGLLAPNQRGELVASNNNQGPIFTVVNRAINIMVGLASTAALVIIIIGSYILITAQGGENQIEKGKNAIIYSLIGLAFILTSYTIVRLVQSILF